jgi:hypothetical protein
VTADRFEFVDSTVDIAGSGRSLALPMEQHRRQQQQPRAAPREIRSYPDGSVAHPPAGSSATKIEIMRVMPCQ